MIPTRVIDISADVTAQSPIPTPNRLLRENSLMTAQQGTVILLGGDEVGDPDLAHAIVQTGPGNRVAILPIAQAFEGPEAAVVAVGEWLIRAGAEVEGLMVASRAEAELAEMAARLDDASIAYLVDGAALHVRMSLKSTAVFDGLMNMLHQGKTVVASGAAATVCCDPMVDSRGGALTVGLGPILAFTVVPHVGHDEDDPHGEKLLRTVGLASQKIPVVALPAQTALVCRPDGTYAVFGDAPITLYRNGSPVHDGIASLGPWWEPAN